ncbi:MAG: DUF302 domain-containing protein [gamma proteobacterium symbiont of Bathyaustriella thionipta]|nr:DUF302 domain-containing protein [gamma proteobacterium symbiont of Bathyaustriella thionipta]
MRKILPVLLMMLIASPLWADGVYEKRSKASVDKVYTAVHDALEESYFWVVHEINIGDNLKHFSENWGDDYNRNKLTAIRSMIICNGGYANKISNTDPKMLALCPLRISVVGHADYVSVLFARPSVLAQGSPALPLVQELEKSIIEAIENGVVVAE